MTKPKWLQVVDDIDPRRRRKKADPKPPKAGTAVSKAEIDRAGKFLESLNK